LLEIAREHPEYGYRRISTELRAQGFYVNYKVIEILHSYWTLKVNIISSLEKITDFDVLYTDFTEIRYRHGSSNAQFMAIIDYRSKLVIGHALGERANTDLALKA